jgi:hypothetical protein
MKVFLPYVLCTWETIKLLWCILNFERVMKIILSKIFFSYFDWPKGLLSYAVRWRFSALCFVYLRNYQVAVMYIKLWTSDENYPFKFKSKFVKTRIIIVRKPAKGHVFNNKQDLEQDSHLLSTNINNYGFDFFFSSLFSLECESPYMFLHHSSLCSHASVHFLKFLTLLCTKTLLK